MAPTTCAFCNLRKMAWLIGSDHGKRGYDFSQFSALDRKHDIKHPKGHQRAGGMACWLGALAALAEGLGLSSRAHMTAHNLQ